MTEEQRQQWDRLSQMMIYGLEKGLWNMLGEASLAVVGTVGQEMLEVLEKEWGLQVEGSDPKELMANIGQLFVEKMGIAESFDIEKEDSTVALRVVKCHLMGIEAKLVEQGIQPFLCPFLNIAMAALRKRMNGATTITQFDVDPESHRCFLKFALLE